MHVHSVHASARPVPLMDTTQAFLYGDVEEDLYVRAPDWWLELVPEEHCLQL